MRFQIDLLAPTTNTTNPLQIRVVLFSSDLLTRWTSITPFSLSADGAWHHAVFAIGSVDLTQVSGASSYSSVISNVGRFLVRYD